MSLPAGTIMIWYGAVVNIPAGFILCDGGNGTPDLRGKFVLGAGDAFNPGDTGGTSSHDHTVATFGHTHTLTAGAAVGSGADWTAETTTKAPSGTTNEVSHVPPYHALCYIMRV